MWHALSANPGWGGPMDRFSFFFAFYGLILGLAVAELLSGFAGLVRARALRRVEAQTALLGLVTFIAICATWIDAWTAFRTVPLNFSGLWAPILIATFYFLAATVVFPREAAEYDRLALYFAERKRFVGAMLLAAELLVLLTSWDSLMQTLHARPAVFWLWYVPLNVLLKGSMVAFLFIRSRRANLVLLILMILLFLIPYWENGAIGDWIHQHFD
jgi:hypothetical protein